MESIKQALILTNSDHLLLNKDVHQQVKIATDTLLNVFSIFIPNKVVTFDDRDPPWMTEFIKLNYEILDYEILWSEVENIVSIIQHLNYRLKLTSQ